MINENELDVEDVAINDDDDGQKEDEDELVLSIMKENQELVNK